MSDATQIRLLVLKSMILAVSLGTATAESQQDVEPARQSAEPIPITIDVDQLEQSLLRGRLDARVTIGIQSITRTPNTKLTVGVHGVKADFGRGWLRTKGPGIHPYGRQPATQQRWRTYENLRPGESRTVKLDLQISKGNRGYVHVRREPVPSSATLYFVASETDVYFSAYSEKHAEANQLRAELIGQQVPEAELERQLRRFWRDGAQANIEVVPPTTMIDDPDPHNSITIRGTVAYTDAERELHPVRGARIFVDGVEDGPGREILGETRTEAPSGSYQVVVPFATDIVVTVLAQNVAARIVNPQDDEIYAVEFDIDSPPDDSTVNLDIEVSNQPASPNNVAFELLDAASHVYEYLGMLGEPYPWPIGIMFPSLGNPVFVERSGLRWIEIPGENSGERFKWYTIFHEYGHYVQFLYGLKASVPLIRRPPGGYLQEFPFCKAEYWVGPGIDDTEFVGKDRAIKIAWAEGWASFFAGVAATELKLSDKFQIDDLIDPWLERPEKRYVHGESSAWGVAAALWDFYDEVAEFSDPEEVAYPAEYLWELSKDSRAHTFSDFWSVFARARTSRESNLLGRILVEQGFAPPVGARPSGSDPLSFSWLPLEGCGPMEYSLQTFDLSSETVIWAAPWQTETSIQVGGSQLARIQRATAKTFALSNVDRGTPATGPYNNYTDVLPSLTAPQTDIEPVDLIVLANISGSMSAEALGVPPRETRLARLRRHLRAIASTWQAHSIDGDRIGVILFDGDAKPLWARQRLSPPGSPTTPIFGPPRVLHTLDSNVDTISQVLNPKPDPRGVGRLFVDDVCTSLGGALQAAFDIFDDESPTERQKAIMLLTDFEVQNQRPLIVGGADITIQSITNHEILSACAARDARMLLPRSNPTFPDAYRPITPNGQAIGSHNVKVLASGIYGAPPRDERAMRQGAIIFVALTHRTGGALASLSSGGPFPKHIYVTNDALALFGR